MISRLIMKIIDSCSLDQKEGLSHNHDENEFYNPDARWDIFSVTNIKDLNLVGLLVFQTWCYQTCIGICMTAVWKLSLLLAFAEAIILI